MSYLNKTKKSVAQASIRKVAMRYLPSVGYSIIARNIAREIDDYLRSQDKVLKIRCIVLDDCGDPNKQMTISIEKLAYNNSGANKPNNKFLSGLFFQSKPKNQSITIDCKITIQGTMPISVENQLKKYGINLDNLKVKHSTAFRINRDILVPHQHRRLRVGEIKLTTDMIEDNNNIELLVNRLQ